MQGGGKLPTSHSSLLVAGRGGGLDKRRSRIDALVGLDGHVWELLVRWELV